MINRRKTRVISVGDVKIGGSNPVVIQSMCNTKTTDIDATVKQILELEKLGCQIVRVAVPDIESAKALKEIKSKINIPLVADIHFDYRIAIESAKYVDKLRINPGNIGNDEHIKKVIESARKAKIPIRIGVNLGSISKKIEEKYGRTAKAMLESAREHIEILERHDFHDIVVSLKASDIETTVEACRLFSKEFDYPQHLGITEAGTVSSGSIKSSIGLGILLNEGIGDTIRVSLSGNPRNEIPVAKNILKFLGLKKGLNIISCPTCARVGFDVEKYANILEMELSGVESEKSIAVMGCAVNGPGEAKNADIAIVGAGDNDPMIYVKGKKYKKVKECEIVKEVKELLKE